MINRQKGGGAYKVTLMIGLRDSGAGDEEKGEETRGKALGRGIKHGRASPWPNLTRRWQHQ